MWGRMGRVEAGWGEVQLGAGCSGCGGGRSACAEKARGEPRVVKASRTSAGEKGEERTSRASVQTMCVMWGGAFLI